MEVETLSSESEEDDESVSSADHQTALDSATSYSDEDHSTDSSAGRTAESSSATSSQVFRLPVCNSFAALKRWFENNESHPYPDQNEKKTLAKESGLTIDQVKKNVRIFQFGLFFNPLLSYS